MTRWITSLFLTAALGAAATAGAADPAPTTAGDWPAWRGPNSSGATVGGPKLAAPWPDGGPKKLWETFLAADTGGCWGSPAAADGRVCMIIMAWQYEITAEKLQALQDLAVPAAAIDDLRANGLYFHQEDPWMRKYKIPADQKKPIFEAIGKAQAIDRVACLDADTGKVQWQRNYLLNTCTGIKENWGTASTPCLANGRVYGSLTRKLLYCLDAKTGAEIWTAPGGGGNASLLLADGVLLSMGSGLVGLDPATGQQLWKGGPASGDCSPAIWRHEGQAYVIYDTGGGVPQPTQCRDVATGKLLWAMPGRSHTPAVEGDFLATVAKGGTGNKGVLAIYDLSSGKPVSVGQVDVVDVSSCPII